MNTKKWFMFCKEQADHHCQKDLMNVEEKEHQNEAADGMFGVEPRADRRRNVSDESFGDSVESDGRVTDAVLQQTDGRSE